MFHEVALLRRRSYDARMPGVRLRIVSPPHERGAILRVAQRVRQPYLASNGRVSWLYQPHRLSARSHVHRHLRRFGADAMLLLA